MQTEMAGSNEGSSQTAMIDSLASMPRKFVQMFGDIDEEKARRLPAHDQWCISEIVVRLGDIEARYRSRLERIISEENPQVHSIWPSPMPDPLPRLHDALGVFQQERAKTVAFLLTLASEAWHREVHHATSGLDALFKQVQVLIVHDEDHLQQIEETGKLVGTC